MPKNNLLPPNLKDLTRLGELPFNFIHHIVRESIEIYDAARSLDIKNYADLLRFFDKHGIDFNLLKSLSPREAQNILGERFKLSFDPKMNYGDTIRGYRNKQRRHPVSEEEYIPPSKKLKRSTPAETQTSKLLDSPEVLPNSLSSVVSPMEVQKMHSEIESQVLCLFSLVVPTMGQVAVPSVEIFSFYQCVAKCLNALKGSSQYHATDIDRVCQKTREMAPQLESLYSEHSNYSDLIDAKIICRLFTIQLHILLRYTHFFIDNHGILHKVKSDEVDDYADRQTGHFYQLGTSGYVMFQQPEPPIPGSDESIDVSWIETVLVETLPSSFFR